MRGFNSRRLANLDYSETDALALHRFLKARGTRSKLMIGEAVSQAGVERALATTAVGTGSQDTGCGYAGRYSV